MNRYLKRAIAGGLLSLSIIFVGTFLLGELSGYKAKVIISNSLPGIRTFLNTVALASATILALLLTVLGLSSRSERKLSDEHYKHVKMMAQLDTMVFMASIISFLLLNLPLTESDELPANWFNYIYYSSLVVSSVLGAGLITVVLMLYNTVVSMIAIVGLGSSEHPLLVDEEEEKEKTKKN